MTVRLEINEISRESWKSKDGKERSALRLVGIDKDDKAPSRFTGEIIVEVGDDQKELVETRLRRDMRVDIELISGRVFGTQYSYRGRIVPESLPDGKTATGKAAAAAGV